MPSVFEDTYRMHRQSPLSIKGDRINPSNNSHTAAYRAAVDEYRRYGKRQVQFQESGTGSSCPCSEDKASPDLELLAQSSIFPSPEGHLVFNEMFDKLYTLFQLRGSVKMQKYLVALVRKNNIETHLSPENQALCSSLLGDEYPRDIYQMAVAVGCEVRKNKRDSREFTKLRSQVKRVVRMSGLASILA